MLHRIPDHVSNAEWLKKIFHVPKKM